MLYIHVSAAAIAGRITAGDKHFADSSHRWRDYNRRYRLMVLGTVFKPIDSLTHLGLQSRQSRRDCSDALLRKASFKAPELIMVLVAKFTLDPFEARLSIVMLPAIFVYA